MLSPEYLEHLTDGIVALYRQYQDDLIADMARRIVRMGMSDASQWQLSMFQEAGGVHQDAVNRIAELTGRSEREIERLFQDAGSRAIAYDNNVFRMAGLDPVPLSLSPSLQQILRAGIDKTLGNVRNLTMTTAVTSQSAYIGAVNQAYMQVVNGGMSYNEAIRRAVVNMADQGITSVLYTGSGKAVYNKADVAARRAVLAGVSQTAAQMQLANMNAMGGEYVETSAHWGARPSHVPWQGRQFHVGGDVDGYPDFETSTGYGTGAGLCGWNCKHSFYAFWPGISVPTYSMEQLREAAEQTITYDGKDMSLYDATQKQREMERNIRASKRELAAINSVVDEAEGELAAELRAEFTRGSVQLKEREAKLKEFLSYTGLDRQREREQAARFGRSPAQKAVWANRKAQAAAQSFDMLKGLKTPEGLTVSKLSDHFGDQMFSRGVNVENARDALLNPLEIGKIKMDAYGRRSQMYVGERATIVINPDDGTLVTAHPTHTKTSAKLKRKKEDGK